MDEEKVSGLIPGKIFSIKRKRALRNNGG